MERRAEGLGKKSKPSLSCYQKIMKRKQSCLGKKERRAQGKKKAVITVSFQSLLLNLVSEATRRGGSQGPIILLKYDRIKDRL